MRVGVVVVSAAVADAAAALVAVSHVAVVVALAYNTHFAFNKVETTQWRSNLHALAVAILAVCVVIKEQSQPTQTLSDFFCALSLRKPPNAQQQQQLQQRQQQRQHHRQRCDDNFHGSKSANILHFNE